MSLFNFLRRLFLGLLFFMNVLTLGFAASEIHASKKLGVPLPPSSALALAGSIAVIILTIFALAERCWPAKTICPVWFETAWTGVIGVFQFSATLSATTSQGICLTNDVDCNGWISLLVFKWIAVVMILTYFVAILSLAFAQSAKKRLVWRSKMSEMNWLEKSGGTMPIFDITHDKGSSRTDLESRTLEVASRKSWYSFSGVKMPPKVAHPLSRSRWSKSTTQSAAPVIPPPEPPVPVIPQHLLRNKGAAVARPISPESNYPSSRPPTLPPKFTISKLIDDFAIELKLGQEAVTAPPRQHRYPDAPRSPTSEGSYSRGYPSGASTVRPARQQSGFVVREESLRTSERRDATGRRYRSPSPQMSEAQTELSIISKYNYGRHPEPTPPPPLPYFGRRLLPSPPPRRPISDATTDFSGPIANGEWRRR